MTNLTGKTESVTALHQLGSVDFLRSGAYVRLNDIAKPFGKRLDNWTRLKSTKELFEAFKTDRCYNGAKPFYTVKGGRVDPSDLRGRSESVAEQGTFAHPDIAIQFAQWCSPSFALWVSRQIRYLLTYGEVNIHYTEWTEEEMARGHQINANDVRELYSRDEDLKS